MLLYFVRHGQTDENAQGIIQGSKDTMLNDQGRWEASKVSKRLREVPFTEAWTSELRRAAETAQIIARPHPGLRLKSHTHLRERSLGSMEGKKWPRGQKRPDDIEHAEVFQKRVCRWFFHALHRANKGANDSPDSPDSAESPVEQVSSPAGPSSPGNSPKSPYLSLQQYKADEGEPIILVVSHGAWMGTLFDSLPKYGFTGPPKEWRNHHCYNTSIMAVRAWPTKPEDKQRRSQERAMNKERLKRKVILLHLLQEKKEKAVAQKGQEKTQEKGKGKAAQVSKAEGEEVIDEETARKLVEADLKRTILHLRRALQPPIETGWDGEILSWGDVGHLESHRAKRTFEEPEQADVVADDLEKVAKLDD